MTQEEFKQIRTEYWKRTLIAIIAYSSILVQIIFLILFINPLVTLFLCAIFIYLSFKIDNWHKEIDDKRVKAYREYYKFSEDV